MNFQEFGATEAVPVVVKHSNLAIGTTTKTVELSPGYRLKDIRYAVVAGFNVGANTCLVKAGKTSDDDFYATDFAIDTDVGSGNISAPVNYSSLDLQGSMWVDANVLSAPDADGKVIFTFTVTGAAPTAGEMILFVSQWREEPGVFTFIPPA